MAAVAAGPWLEPTAAAAGDAAPLPAAVVQQWRTQGAAVVDGLWPEPVWRSCAEQVCVWGGGEKKEGSRRR